MNAPNRIEVMVNRAKSLEILFDQEIQSTVLQAPNESMTVNDLLRINGLEPRDGSFRFLVNDRGEMVNHQTILQSPQTVRCSNPTNVEQLWIDDATTNGFSTSYLSNDERISVLGAEPFSFQAVYVPLWRRKVGGAEQRVGYVFSPNPPFYRPSTLVYLQVPVEGNNGLIYNPLTGKVDLKIQLHMSEDDLNRHRGFWSAWQLNADCSQAMIRHDLTPLSSTFKPHKNHVHRKEHTTKKGNNNTAIQKHGRRKKRPVTVKKIRAAPTDSAVRKGHILHGSKYYQALICGPPSEQATSLKGDLVALKNKTRPAMVNLDGYSYGMTQFIKIPEQGDTYSLFVPQQKVWVDCEIRGTSNMDIEAYRGRWVIARLKRNARGRRYLLVESLPNDFREI